MRELHFEVTHFLDVENCAIGLVAIENGEKFSSVIELVNSGDEYEISRVRDLRVPVELIALETLIPFLETPGQKKVYCSCKYVVDYFNGLLEENLVVNVKEFKRIRDIYQANNATLEYKTVFECVEQREAYSQLLGG